MTFLAGHLTRQQQTVIVTVILLLLVGGAVKAWRTAHPSPPGKVYWEPTR